MSCSEGLLLMRSIATGWQMDGTRRFESEKMNDADESARSKTEWRREESRHSGIGADFGALLIILHSWKS